MDEIELLSLPNDALLAVLAFLPLGELFRCRRVCRRLRDLCLHRDLWRDAALDGACSRGLVRAALSLAPCLGGIDFSEMPLEGVASFATGTECVVVALSFRVSDEENAAAAADIILQLSAAGGVRVLYLTISCTASQTLQLLREVGRLTSLEVLNFEYLSEELIPAASCDGRVTSSLKELRYLSRSSSSSPDPFLLQLLATHSATLRHLFTTPPNKVIPASLLARMPEARTLSCWLNQEEDLHQLLALPNLHNLLCVAAYETECPPGALDFLRRTSQLRTVRFYFPSTVQQCQAPLLALSESRSARVLRSLDFGVDGELDEAWLEPFAAVLDRFPSLRDLKLLGVVPSNDFLRAVSPTSVPCLTKLAVDAPYDSCPHAWLHESDMDALVARNPCLLVCVDLGSEAAIPEDCSCLWCFRGCHSELRLPMKTWYFRYTLEVLEERPIGPFDGFPILCKH